MTTRATLTIALTCLTHLTVAGPIEATPRRTVDRAETGPWTATVAGAALAELLLAFEQNISGQWGRSSSSLTTDH
jgi:hypothetical protein